MDSTPSALKNLVAVACHAPFKESIEAVPEQPERDDAWVLQEFQRGEPPFYIAHIRHGIAALENDPEALLIFSGGYTRREAGLRWSEADTYAAITRRFQWWRTEDATTRDSLAARTTTEDYSRDSFENLLFSICRFQQVTGRYPHEVTMVSWAFKEARFELHRAALRFPAHRFHFAGANQPSALEPALSGEAATFRQFVASKFGNTGKLAEKRITRNPFHREHPFRNCAGMTGFFDFIEAPENCGKEFPGLLPWERQ